MPVIGSPHGGRHRYISQSFYHSYFSWCVESFLLIPASGMSCNTHILHPLSFKYAGIALKGDKYLDTWDQNVHSGMLIPTFQLRILLKSHLPVGS